MSALHFLGFDYLTSTRSAVIRAMKGKRVADFQDCGAYREDAAYSKMLVDTTLTEKELETWLDGIKGVELVGTFTRKDCRKVDGYLWDDLQARPLSALRESGLA